MDNAEAIGLIKDGVGGMRSPTHWLDLGSGKGLFTTALASLLAPGSKILSIDRNREALDDVPERVGEVDISTVLADFRTFDIPKCDGILMANALHFVEDREQLLSRLTRKFGEGGRLIIVEYEMNRSNAWVPFPVPFKDLRKVVVPMGPSRVERLAQVPSRFGRDRVIYSAMIEF